jgi:hypothetical protein
MDPILHTYHDGTKLRIMSAKKLITIPIWKGNRIKNKEHLDALKAAIGTQIQSLDKGYHVIKYKEEDDSKALVDAAYIIDGQHRVSVLTDFFNSYILEPDFNVTYTEVVVENEHEAIEYFNRINNVKPIQFKEDPTLIANNYVAAIVKVFPGKKGAPLFRDKATHRPYMVTEELRKYLRENVERLIDPPATFAQKLLEVNRRLLRELELAVGGLGTIPEKEHKCAQRAIEVGFALGYYKGMPWMSEMLD